MKSKPQCSWVYWQFCHVCYWVMNVAPVNSRLFFAVLPYAGYYAYDESHIDRSTP